MLIIVVDFFKTNQYAEQRFDSRKKPTTRAALKIKSILQVLAEESEKGPSEKRPWAKSLLEYLTKYDTLLLLGLEADFLTEFSKWVHAEDHLDPDPSRTLVRQIQA